MRAEELLCLFCNPRTVGAEHIGTTCELIACMLMWQSGGQWEGLYVVVYSAAMYCCRGCRGTLEG